MLKKTFLIFAIFALFFTFLPFSRVGAADVKIVPVQLFADSENADYEAYRAMDGDTNTMWHTQFSSEPNIHQCPFPIACGYSYSCGYDHPGATVPPAPGTMPLPEGAQRLPWIAAGHPDQEKEASATWAKLFGIAKKPGNNVGGPHALGIDLGGVYPLTGFAYTPRVDQGNGTFGKYELYVAADAKDGKAVFGEPIARGEFSGSEKTDTIHFDKPIEARYLKFVNVASRNGDVFASVAECQPIAEGYRFVASRAGQLQNNAKLVARLPFRTDNPDLQERMDEWNLLAERFKTPLYWDAIKDEVASPDSLILPKDRDPLDVVWRRYTAMMKDFGYNNMDEALGVKVELTPVEDIHKRFDVFCSVCSRRNQFMLKEKHVSPLFAKDDTPKEYLFIKRHRAGFQHMCDQFYGTNQRPGGGLFVLNIETGKVRNLLENSTVQSGRLKGQKLDKGSFLSPDVSFDGKKIAFAYVECVEPTTPFNLGDMTNTTHVHTLDVTRGHWDVGRSYHIFTCNADGSDLQQVTDGTWNDFDPCWLPNGRMAFISERRNGYLRCGRECPTYTLYDMNPDGTQMRCLSFHETNEWNPSVTNDGKILYTRWDYIDRYGCVVHHPWTTTLDGRDPRTVHGNYSHRHRRPDAEFDCRAIPDSNKYIATAGPHHGQSF
ncbi:MAG: discoidin domain-containing protein, partial [Planctomycetaceae bacterium]|nr:discoidin domain-containing protein [Planctomycetaceae bacterium]